MASSRLCSIPDCDKPVCARGWCSKHYQRWHNHNDPLWQKDPTPTICSIPDCGKPVINSRGWCGLHYQRWQKLGDPLRTKRARRGICSIPDCGKPHYGNGLCASHNSRLKRYGDPLLLKTASPGEPLRFVHEVAFAYEGDDCLIWPYGTSGGYGVLDIDRKKRYVHRLVCEAVHGPAPTSRHEAAHSCGRGDFGCVARRHLSWKTPSGNQADKLIHGTMTRGTQHGNAKLTEDAVHAIRALEGVATYNAVARQFGVSISTVRDIQTRKRWAWL